MKKLLIILTGVLLISASVCAAPLTDFHNNTFQIDLAFTPNASQQATNASGSQSLPNVSDFSGNLTVAFNDFLGLRLGATSIASSAITWNNSNPGQLGMTQANLVLVVNPVEYIQPFIGVQYASANVQVQLNGSNTSYTAAGICGGLQLSMPLGDIFKLNANGLYGAYSSSAYGGVALCLGKHIDIDAGYSYEYYNAGKIGAPQDGGTTTLAVQGLRAGLSFRI